MNRRTGSQCAGGLLFACIAGALTLYPQYQKEYQSDPPDDDDGLVTWMGTIRGADIIPGNMQALAKQFRARVRTQVKNSSPEMAVAADAAPAKTYEVETVKDVAYYEGEDADKVKHKLDLYVPKDKKDFPVLFFVHGGAWISGDKNYFGVYSADRKSVV